MLRRERVSSTMDVVATLARAGAPEGLVVVADDQTSGRGRAGRSWVAPPGSALLCSTLLRPQVGLECLSALPLLVGVAVARAIEALAPVTSAVKWPNDVLIDGRKVAGILLNVRAATDLVEFVVVGIGINISAGALSSADAISMADCARRPIDRDALLDRLLDELSAVYTSFVETPTEPDLEPWRARAYLKSEEVVIHDGGREVTGRYRDIDSSGALLLEEADGSIRRVVSGDLTRGPRPLRRTGVA